MTNKNFFGFSRPATDPAPTPPPAPPGYPNTFLPRAAGSNDGTQRAEVFDPALLHFRHAFRLADPVLRDPHVAWRWLEAKRVASDFVLAACARPPQVDRLVLRGSRLLRAWFGDAAREPGDLDFVARCGLADAPALFQSLIAEVGSRPQPAGVTVDIARVAVDEIWNYSRVPGRRAVFPWSVPGLPAGVVQLDVVLGELLPEPPQWTSVPTEGGGAITLWTATPATSLAWKILWLATDLYPQGKDLFDATLLAERVRLPRELLERAFLAVNEPSNDVYADSAIDWYVDWKAFADEYPGVPGDAASWQQRLANALAPTLSRPTKAPGA